MKLTNEQKWALIKARKDLHRIAGELGNFTQENKLFGHANMAIQEAQLTVDELLIDGDILDQQTNELKEQDH